MENGVHISLHTFPEERKLFLKWIVAILRHIGKHFQVATHTRVCSRQFKPSDYIPSLTGRKRTLKPTAVPSLFHWKKRSPVKRKAPTREEVKSKGKRPQKRQLRKLIYQLATPRAKYFWSHRKLRFSRQSQKIWKILQQTNQLMTHKVSFVTFKLKMNVYVKKSTKSRL